MSTKKMSQNYLSFSIASVITIVAGYALSLAATSVYMAKLKTVHLPLGDSSLILGGLYFTIVAVVGILIAYFYERFTCV